MDIAKSGAGGASINLKDLGIEDMGEVIENMNRQFEDMFGGSQTSRPRCSSVF